jgi:REP element-mobilizing transposase RayT
MANTFSQVYLHLVFSTKNRADLISREIEERVWAYIAGVAKTHRMTPIQTGGIDNHVHALVGSSTTTSPAQAAQYLKGDSSKWLRAELVPNFGWQDGYGVFSVSKSLIPTVTKYIQNQRQHHANQSFEDEFVELLKLHEVSFDERYLFG